MKTRPLLLILLLIIPVMLLQGGEASQALETGSIAKVDFSCHSISGMPRKECEALVALYNSANGPNWKRNDGWLRTNNPCNWYGVNCQMILGKVIHLMLPNNNLFGTLPKELGNLSPWWLDLSGNNLTGEIPPELTKASIGQLLLNNNNLSGELPDGIGQFAGHLALDVSHNRLHGELPYSLTQAENLSVLRVNQNAFYGELPRTLPNLKALNNFNYEDTALCEPTAPYFQEWLSQIRFLDRSGRKCENRPWTLIYYYAADNNIAHAAEYELSMLAKSRNNEQVNTVYFHDFPGAQGARYGWFVKSGKQYFYVPEPSTGKADTLTDYVNWARKHFPAEKYALILRDHSYGLSGFGIDDTASGDSLDCSNHPCLTFPEMETALLPIPRLDIIYIAACSSATIEVAYQLRHEADYLVASEQLTISGKDHSDYIAGDFWITKNTPAEELAKAMAKAYARQHIGPLTMSVMKLDQVDTVKGKIDKLAGLLEGNIGVYADELRDVRNEVQHFGNSVKHCMDGSEKFDLVDLLDATIRIREVIEDAEIRAAANELIVALKPLVVDNHRRSGDAEKSWRECQWDLDDSHGVAIHWPENKASFYKESWLAFAAGANWGTAEQGFENIDGRMAVEAGSWGSFLVDYINETNPNGPDTAVAPPMAESLSVLDHLFLPLATAR